MSTAIILVLSVLCTSFISGVIGMGGGMILMGVLGLIFSVQKAMIFHGITQLFSNGGRVFLFWEHINWKIVTYYLIGAGGSTVFFLFFSWIPSKAMMFFLLGSFPFITYLSFFKPPSIESKKGALFCGVLVQFAQMTAGASGPILDTFYNSTELSRFQIMGTKAITQCFGHFAKALFYLSLMNNKFFNEDNLIIFILPLLTIIGNYLGKKTLNFLSDKQFKQLTFHFTQIIGMVFVIKGIFLLR